jgi:tRNA A-37 threonylcarbamoyl transferase component Bud32
MADPGQTPAGDGRWSGLPLAGLGALLLLGLLGLGLLLRRAGALGGLLSAREPRAAVGPNRADASEHAQAAERLRVAGDFEGAMREYEAAGAYDEAIACAFQSGSRDRAVEYMEKKGAFFDAAREALDMHDADLALRVLQKIPRDDGNYGDSCILLTQLFAQKGEPELALQKLDEAVEVFGSDSFPELREKLAALLEDKGHVQKALEAYETIYKLDPEVPGVVEKIEALRARARNDDENAAPASAFEPGSMAALEGRYEILGELGRGAMGIVYQARDRRLGRIVALKRLPDDLQDHPTAVPLFLREARAAAALNHANIVTLFDVDQADGVYYLTMEYMDGLPLDSVLSKRDRLSVRDTLRIALQVSNGLEYAHSENIIHRDIKPSNLFYTRKKQVKIMDFGLAKVVEEVRKAASVIGGTPYYMAPEQALGEFCDHRADQYAFGVTIFQLVTGRLPFDEGDVTHHHRHTPPPDPREFAVEVPAEMAELILRMMAKSAENRWETSEEVTRRISALLRVTEAESAA